MNNAKNKDTIFLEIIKNQYIMVVSLLMNKKNSFIYSTF